MRLALAILSMSMLLTGCGEEEIPDWVQDRLDAENPDPPDIARLKLSPSPLDFGEVGRGGVYTSEVIFRNESDEPVSIEDISVDPAGGAVQLGSALHTEINLGVVVDPGFSFVFDVRFDAVRRGGYHQAMVDVHLSAGVLKSLRVQGDIR